MKKYILIVFFLSFLSINFFTVKANASPKLEVNAEVGINGYVKYDIPAPLKLTITNNGSDFKGDLVIDLP